MDTPELGLQARIVGEVIPEYQDADANRVAQESYASERACVTAVDQGGNAALAPCGRDSDVPFYQWPRCGVSPTYSKIHDQLSTSWRIYSGAKILFCLLSRS
jgi:hypothetical protein